MSNQAVQLTEVFKQLSLSEKLQLIELFFRNIREEAMKQESADVKRRKAAESLLLDYTKDEELTAFTTLDGEPLYETK
ncbi:MAG: hypothetical protein IT258_13325 [Saprospiraceae bacterium]|nr:hypothetical protein [Saprospiraceae bacterium]